MADTAMREYEKPVFDHGEWTALTRHGMVWKLFPDARNQNPNLYYEAVDAVQKIIDTGQPLFGGWR